MERDVPQRCLPGCASANFWLAVLSVALLLLLSSPALAGTLLHFRVRDQRGAGLGGVAVMVNGALRGVTGQRGTWEEIVSGGRLTIVLSKPGYKDRVFTHTCEEGDVCEAPPQTLTTALVEVTIQTTPHARGLTVHVDGKATLAEIDGMGSARMMVEPGQRSFSIPAARFDEHIERVEVRAPRRVRLPLKLRSVDLEIAFPAALVVCFHHEQLDLPMPCRGTHAPALLQVSLPLGRYRITASANGVDTIRNTTISFDAPSDAAQTGQRVGSWLASLGMPTQARNQDAVKHDRARDRQRTWLQGALAVLGLLASIALWLISTRLSRRSASDANGRRLEDTTRRVSALRESDITPLDSAGPKAAPEPP